MGVRCCASALFLSTPLHCWKAQIQQGRASPGPRRGAGCVRRGTVAEGDLWPRPSCADLPLHAPHPVAELWAEGSRAQASEWKPPRLWDRSATRILRLSLLGERLTFSSGYLRLSPSLAAPQPPPPCWLLSGPCVHANPAAHSFFPGCGERQPPAIWRISL